MAESLILPAKKSIEELQQDVTRRIQDIDIPLPKKSIEELQLDVTRRIQEKCQLIFFIEKHVTLNPTSYTYSKNHISDIS